MKLLVYSHYFAPSVGGVESIVFSLASGLAGMRDSNGVPQFEITLVAQTPAGNYDDRGNAFHTVRRPSFAQLWQLVRSSDIVHVAGPALAPLFLGLLERKPVVVEHHGFQTICPNGQLLFEAARILREQGQPFELLIIGDGPERDSLEHFAREAQLDSQVRFTGRLDGAQLHAALAQSSVVVVPSLGGEVFGLVVAENMLRGLPVVASDLGAFVEVLGDAGFTFRTGDAAALAAALSRHLNDSSLALCLGQRARERALDFCSRERMLESHANVYRRV